MYLSIVIPVYNGAGHIEKCLNSIWAQNLDHNQYEVICVDDCSTDNTIALLKKIKQQHNNLRIIKNDKNRRAGGSRNHGVLEAKGEYVVFIDADDYFHHNALYYVIDVLRKDSMNLDIILCDFAREQFGTINNKPTHIWRNKNVMNGRDFMICNGLPWGPCQYIFKRKIMVENEIFFEENVTAEDVDWTHKLALIATKMQYKPILLSHYVLQSTSQTADEYKKYRYVKERIFAGYRLYQISLQYQNDTEVSNHIKSIAFSYLQRGIMLMVASWTKITEKKDTIIKYVPDIKTSIFIIDFAKKHPLLYANLSNMMSPFVKLAIIIKRYIKGR